MVITFFFKDMENCNYNNYPKKVYKPEHSRMLIEILNSNHIQEKPQYFIIPHSRNDFITNIREHIL